LLIITLVFLIIGAIVAIETRNLLSSVISVGAVGFGLSVMFLLLGAPDLAITQMVVEVLALVVLVRGTLRVDLTAVETHRDTFAMVASLVFFGLFLAFAYRAFLSMPPFGEPLMTVSRQFLERGQELTGSRNIIEAIIFDFRGIDTIGEGTVLFAAIVGVLVIMRRKGRKGESGE